MSRVRAGVVLVAVLSLVPLSAARAADSATEARRAAEVRKKLEATHNLTGFDDPDTKLEDALAYLTKLSGLTFEINEKAFREEQIENPPDVPLRRAIPKMADVPLEKVLRRVLDRVPSASGATFVVRGGVVQITTRKAASPSTWDEAPEISVAFDKRELKEALQEIADATGVNVVLDARAADKGKTPVSATMRDVGVDTAVQLLANMAGLTIMPVENVLYVTTKENAKALRAELLKLEPEKAEEPKPEPKPKKDQ